MISLPVLQQSQPAPAKTLAGRRPRREEVPKTDCLCDYCTALCCRYFALPIDQPTEIHEFDYIRWYLLHDRATVFVDSDQWYLLVHTTCKHLRADNLCGIYETRPQICRDYSTKRCEYDDTAVYDRYFETPEQVAEYMEARFFSDDPTRLRTPPPASKPVDK